MRYAKPHLPYDQQLQRLSSRGLTYSDQAAALGALKSVGYYRFSAYTYPFREALPHPQPDAGTAGVEPSGTSAPEREADGQESSAAGYPRTAGPRRGDRFVDGATFEDALKLCQFDDRLRRSLFDALQEIEIGIRVQIGYQLGKAHPFGHLGTAYLDRTACDEAGRTPHTTMYEDWRENYERLTGDARGEEFVKHFHLNYDGEMPIWVAAECMTFGSLTRLYSLLLPADKKKIAANLKIRDAGLVYKYLKALGVLRNHCAHSNRVWNRATIYPPKRPPEKLTHPRIHHLRDCDADRIYFLAALTAQFAITLNPTTNWPRNFKSVAKKFPAPLAMTLQNQMGFPEDWETLPIWNYDPHA